MRTMISMVVAMLFLTVPAMAIEYDAIIYTTAGEMITGTFVRHSGDVVTLRINVALQNYNTADLGVVIFDNNYTNFYTDRGNLERANPHMVCQKNGDVLAGKVTYVVPGTKSAILINSRNYIFDSVTIARIYYSPDPFFEAVDIVSNNEVALKAVEEEKEKEKEKEKEREREKEKEKEKKKEEYEQLFGGRVFIKLHSGGSTIGVIYDVTGVDPALVLTDGRRFLLSSIAMINCQSTQDNYPADKNKIRPGFATIIMRNGAVVYGQIIDFRGTEDGFWELSDGSRLSRDQVARIYF